MVTTGFPPGTSGAPPWRAIGLILAVAPIVAIVNATSILMERDPHLSHPPSWTVWTCEITSVVAVVALLPGLVWAAQRFDPARIGWTRAVAAHVGLAFVFSAAHVALMVTLRTALYAVVDWRYDFAPSGLAAPLIYELRKDLLIYALLVAVLSLEPRLWRGPARGEAPGPRLELRTDRRTVLLDPAEIFLVEAAANYVEVRTAGGDHLVRGTLASFEERLRAAGFVRIHRSRLVNPAHIRMIERTQAGDFALTLDDGRIVQASRRYKASLEQLSALTAPL